MTAIIGSGRLKMPTHEGKIMSSMITLEKILTWCITLKALPINRPRPTRNSAPKNVTSRV